MDSAQADSTAAHARCTTLLVQIAARELRFLSSQMGQDQFIAGIASRSTGRQETIGTRDIFLFQPIIGYREVSLIGTGDILFQPIS